MIKTVVAVSDLVMLVLSAQERRIPLPPELGQASKRALLTTDGAF